MEEYRPITLNETYIRKIIDFMNEFSVHKVVFRIVEDEYLRINITKPLDYNKNYFKVSLEDLSNVYYNGSSNVFNWKEFNNLEEFFNSKIYETIKKYKIKNKIIGVNE